MMDNFIIRLEYAFRQFSTGVLVAVTLLSCAAPGEKNQSQAVALIENDRPPAAGVDVAQNTRPQQTLTDDLMFDILLAEIAGQRGEMGTSVPHYLQAALIAQDPRVAERAVQIASFAKQYQAAERAARRWVELDPDSVEARKALIALALHNGDRDEVIAQLDYLLTISDDPEAGYSLATTILAHEEDKDAALDAMQKLVAHNPDNPYAWMALSRVAVAAEQLDKALQAVNKALAASPDLAAAVLLKAQILVRMERRDEARRLLADAVARHPESTTLHFAYGRMLLDAEDLEGSRAQFARVVKLEPNNPDGLYSLALLELETGQYKAGEKHLLQLIEIDEGVQNAYYYLGYAKLKQNDDDAALEWYGKVESGDYWSQAQLRIAEILVRQGNVADMQNHMQILRQKDPAQSVTYYLLEGQVLTDAQLDEEAFELYGKALQASPDNVDLLYAHSLAAEQLGKLEIAERDMRHILELEPDNVRTLNALGYTLADQTTRYEEALGYINRAYAQEPNDPAIIDSLGWVQYRLGNLDEARSLLQRAWDMTQDSEIGAHLGEVMWVQGDRDSARKIWKASRQSSPDNPVLLEVINRYSP
ncbi:MAG: tetratricopeptide repeat protein [Gammaproteobacteria bacterium]